MGKKGVILDNGKKAQSSMALYWKKNQQQSKHPKEKRDHEEKQEEGISDKRVMSNFEKWKMHKQKLITKAYTKPAQKVQQKSQKVKKDEEEDDLIEQMMQKKKPKIMTIPGFKSKGELASKLQIEKPKQADQSTNVLKLPSHMQGLTQQQIIQLLRQKKAKQQMMKRGQQQRKEKKDNIQKQDGDMLLGDDYINLMKKKDKEEEQKQNIQEEKAPVEEAFFKSQILNKIEKEGIQKVLVKQKVEENVAGQQQKGQNNHNQNGVKEQKQQKPQQSHSKQPKITIPSNPRFIPRALKK